MEDNRKGTWEDVTGECKVKLNYTGYGFGGGVYVEHGENLVISYGAEAHDESGVDYRVSFSNDRYQGYFKVEHFIPKPKWVDVTQGCELKLEDGYINVMHGGVFVAEIGQKVIDLEYDGYRVTSRPTEDDDSGFFKVEKRNG